jgi:hypothetical protein
MAIELSGLAQLVASLGEGRDTDQPDRGGGDDSSLSFREWDDPLPPPPRADALDEIAQAVAGARQRLEALAASLGELRRQIGGDGGGTGQPAARSSARSSK